MTSISSAFKDKNAEGQHYSMTRVTAFFFAVVYLSALATYAYRAKEINWPFAVLGVVTLLAVPIQALFGFLGQWISSREGRELLSTAVHKVEESLLAPHVPTPGTPTVNVSASVGSTPGGA